MRDKTKLYVWFVALGAVVWTAALYARTGPTPPQMLADAVLLCALAATAEFLSYVLPRAASGSVAFIPYFATAMIVPGWQSVVCLVGVKTIVEVFARRAPIKAVLNVSAHALLELIAIVVYTGLGGPGFRTIASTGLANITRVAGIPAVVAMFVALACSNTLVNIAISLSSGRSFGAVARDNQRATAGMDVVAIPLVFIFAWVYVAFGAIAAAALWVPILGLRQVHRINIELEQTNEELLELMVKSLEARDPYTSGHSRRVQQYSMIIARAIGLRERQVEQIGRAALLHDVGKIYEKYAAVLSKQDKLTPEEWAIIQDHPTDGANLISTMTKLRDVVPAVRHHHENWNGTGYPHALAGEQIPLASRIIRFADTIDAMTTERPYRAPLTETQVRAELIRCRGTQFDPNIADRLLASPLYSSLFASPAMVETPRVPFSVVAGRFSGKHRAIIRRA